MVLLYILLLRLPPITDDSHARHADEARGELPDEFVEEIHKCFPLTYHHSRIEKARFSAQWISCESCYDDSKNSS